MEDEYEYTLSEIYNKCPQQDYSRPILSQREENCKPEIRLLMIGEKYKEKQKILKEEQLKRKQDEEDMAMVPEKGIQIKSSRIRFDLSVEERMQLYLERCIQKYQEKLKESENEELSLLRDPQINSKSRKIVANMTV